MLPYKPSLSPTCDKVLHFFHIKTGDNPVFQPPLNVTELENKSSAIKRQQGNPVEEFLESKDYTELLVSD